MRVGEMMSQLRWSLAWMFAILVVVGCDRGPELTSLSGKVLLDGKPLAFGAVMLQPLGGGQPSSAQIQADGTFTMQTRGVGDGAALGVNAVRVTCYPGQKPNADTGDGELVLGSSLIPMEYTSFNMSGLTVDVKPGENPPFVIELMSKRH